MFSKANDDRIAEGCYVGKRVYWTIIKGGRVQSGVVEEIRGKFITVKHSKGSSGLFIDEIWSTAKMAKKYPAL